MNESDRPRNPPHLMNAFGEFCVLNGSQRIATGLRSRDDKVVGKDGVGSVTTRSLSLRGESASEGRDNPSCLGEGGRVMWFACWRTVDRHGLSALAMTGYENGTLGCEITPGLRLLAWPIWAGAPLVQARRAPLFYPLVPSSFRP